MTGKPYFHYPLEHLATTENSLAWGTRTLSDDQLASETDELRQMASKLDLATLLALRVYEREAARRASPAHKFDEELDAALTRLERTTTPEDRNLVRRIGEDLRRVGPRAVSDAYARMMDRASPKRRQTRERILAKRWADIMDAYRPLKGTAA